MTFNYAKLKGKIKEKFDTQGKFAEHLGVSENTVSRKLSGQVGFSQEDIVVWCEALGIDLQDAGAFFYS